MPRHRQHTPLRVLLNNRLLGQLSRRPDGAITFHYSESWLSWEHAIPVSLSLPLTEEPYRGASVHAVFDNLLPDSPQLRRRIAGKVGAESSDAYSLLAKIGQDCTGALQFYPEDQELDQADTTRIHGTPIAENEIEALLTHLSQAPLGLGPDPDFRISVAGAQEKTALLWHQGRWHRPHGTTPTTHLIKPAIGTLASGLDLTDSVENEYYCLRLAQAFGLPAAHAEMHTFGETKALVVTRFDRRHTADGRLLRLPQEDCCQALSIPSSQKYQSDGGPGMERILRLLHSSDTPADDQKQFLKAQIFFWLIGATDGHAKNFSLHLRPGGRFTLTPLYDILTAQPHLEARQITRQKMKLAMSAGNSRHYVLDRIRGRHFQQTAARAGLPEPLIRTALEEISQQAESALQSTYAQLPPGFPEAIPAAVTRSLRERLHHLEA